MSARVVTAVTAEDKMEVDEAGSGCATPKVDEGKPAQGGTGGKGKSGGRLTAFSSRGIDRKCGMQYLSPALSKIQYAGVA